MTLTPPEATHDERIARVERGLRIADPSNSGNVLTTGIRSRMEALAVPGVSVVVIDRGSIAWARGYGVREAGGSDPVTPATRFQAASISKPVTALAALRLVDAGVLDLDADVNDTLAS